MLCFNYIANIIKLMRLLSREGMRDVDIGICWDAGYIGICGIGGEDGGYAEIWGDMGDMRRYAEICGDMGGYGGRTTSPKSARPGCRFWTSPPQSTKDGKQERQTICKPKKECLFFI